MTTRERVYCRRSPGRAIRPAYEGIETQAVTSSATMPEIASCRAIRPAYEGIETRNSHPEKIGLAAGRAIRPAYEGIETMMKVAV